MRLWERVTKLAVSNFLQLGNNAVLRVESPKGSFKEISTRELVNVLDVQNRLVTLTATGAITQDLHEGKTLLMGEVGGDAAATFTLPEATGSGAIYKFVVSVVNTSNYVIAALTTDTLAGVLVGLADGGATTVGWEVDGTDDRLTLNGTTTGGAAIGDWIEVQDILDGVWSVRGQITQNGIEATPASST